MPITDFKNKKVLIMGLGLHGGGTGAASFFSKLGSKVTVTDLKSKKELRSSLRALKRFKKIIYHLGGHKGADFASADFIIKNPGVPDHSKFLAVARKAGVPILSDVEIFFTACSAPIIGVTGTKGKSTVAWLTGEFLRRSGKRVWLGGNIRKSVLEILPKIRKKDWVVLELSSFQLDSLANSRLSPGIAVITNIFPDHLNRYAGMRSYTASKCGIFKFQKHSDHLFINKRDKLVRHLAKKAPSRIALFDAAGDLAPFKKFIKTSIPDYHLANIAAAVALARHAGVGDDVIKKVLDKFSCLPGRMELVKTTRGVEFINDTTATNPTASSQAVIAAKKRIGRHKLHVIAGGYDKGLPVGDFVSALNECAATAVFLPGGASDKMAERLKNFTPAKTKIYRVPTMAEAVKTARRMAEKGDMVLLSPGAASFGLFRHEFERGEAFKKAVNLVRGKTPAASAAPLA